jgi:hypothetical protein
MGTILVPFVPFANRLLPIFFPHKKSDNRQTSVCRANSLKMDLEKLEELTFVDC